MTIKEMKDQHLLLFECISGSRAYGLHNENSDTDIKGVFYLPRSRFYGLGYIPQISNESNDEVYYELGRFVELLIRNNPSMLELLATPEDCILYRHPVMDSLPVELFLSKLCKDSFGGYAYAQIKKARGYNKKMLNPVEKERKTILDFCYVIDGKQTSPLSQWLNTQGWDENQVGLVDLANAKGLYAMYCSKEPKQYRGIISSEDANDLSLSSVDAQQLPVAYLYCNKEGYSTYCKTYREYWDWVENRNEHRYQGNLLHGQGFDAKNMMHTIRLLQTCEEILRDGKLNIQPSNREELLQIKAGARSYEELMAMSDELILKSEAALAISQLPDEPDKKRIEAILVTIRNELYSIW